jgi:hypothetical protein
VALAPEQDELERRLALIRRRREAAKAPSVGAAGSSSGVCASKSALVVGSAPARARQGRSLARRRGVDSD